MDKEIQDLLQRLVTGLKQGTTSSRAAQEELVRRAKTLKQYAEYNKALEKLVKQEVDLKEITQDLNEAYSDQYDALRKNYKLQEDINDGLKSLYSGFISLGDASKDGGDKIATYTGMLKGIPLFGQGLDMLGQSFDFNLRSFRSLAEVGADFGQSLIGLRLASRNAALPLLEFTDFIASNSQNLAALFGSVNAGTVAVSEFAKNIRSDVLPELAGLGITTENYLDYLETFLEQSRIQGRTERLTQQAVTEGVKDYAIQLDRVTKLTGIQRANLDATVRAQKSDAVFQGFLRTQEPRRAAELQTFIAGLQNLNPALGDAVKNILSTGFPLGEFEGTLVGTSDNLLGLIDQLATGNISIEEFKQGLNTNADIFLNRFGPQVLRAGGIVGDVGNALLTYQGRVAKEAEIRTEQTRATEAFTSGLGVTQESLRRFKGSLEGIQTAFLETIGPNIAGFLGVSSKGLIGIAEGLTKFVEENPKLTSAALVTALSGKLLFEYAEQIGIVTAGTAAGIRLSGMAGGIAGLTTMLGGAVRIFGSIAIALTALGIASDAKNKLKESETLGDVIAQSLKTIGGYTAAGAGVGTAIAPGAGTVIGGVSGFTYGSLLVLEDAVRRIMEDGGITKRASGGDMLSGRSYLVGEQGPELVIPRQDGYVMNASQTQSALRPIENNTVTTPQSNAPADMVKKMQEFIDIAKKMEMHLGVSTASMIKTAENTARTVSGVRQLSGNLI